MSAQDDSRQSISDLSAYDLSLSLLTLEHCLPTTTGSPYSIQHNAAADVSTCTHTHDETLHTQSPY